MRSFLAAALAVAAVPAGACEPMPVPGAALTLCLDLATWNGPRGSDVTVTYAAALDADVTLDVTSEPGLGDLLLDAAAAQAGLIALPGYASTSERVTVGGRDWWRVTASSATDVGAKYIGTFGERRVIAVFAGAPRPAALEEAVLASVAAR